MVSKQCVYNQLAENETSKNVTQDNGISKQKLKKKFEGKNRKANKIWFAGVPKALLKTNIEEEDTTGKCLVKTNSYNGLTRSIALDCEFVGVGYGGKDDALARVSIVNQFGHVLLDEYVRPKETITDYRTAFSGITPHHMRPGGPAKTFEEVQAKVMEICNDRVLVGHAVHNDLRVLMMSHPKRDIRDTSRYRPFKALFKGRNPSLKALTERLLGINVQTGEHDSVEDARATMRIYTLVKRVWEAQVKAKLAGKPAKEIQRLAGHLQFPSASGEIPVETNLGCKVHFTHIAKIALDVNSEFSAGDAVKPMTSKKPDVPTMTVKGPKKVPMINGRKVSQHRQRFIEKRRRIRRQQAQFPSSVSNQKRDRSLFS
nr:rna exonuclease 4 [Hymenolepis microstoma]